ncbi:hypothetical protein BK666_02145 [Pseudomonas frederiksbergensis]|uniref:Uncharacterized protein n=2 Tax=Pseudomonas frederiksbergensis TaxID=104087 RepID=A0A423KIB2_9PSED|nr:hypothetical protein BK666_02145 [Pseudomonas frederiksbergensis]
MPFAQLLGFNPRADEGDDEDKSKRAKGEGDDPDKDDDTEDGKVKGKKAENDKDDDKDGDDGDAKGAKGEGDDPDKDDAKGRKAKRAEDDDEETASNQAVVSQERARCAQIVAHGFKAGSPEQACVFAFDTNMSADAAISAINAAGAVGGKGGNFKDRMAAAKVQNVGAGGGDDLPADVSPVAQQIIAAAARAQPQTR